jgi:hypothetical protein
MATVEKGDAAEVDSTIKTVDERSRIYREVGSKKTAITKDVNKKRMNGCKQNARADP